MKPLIIASLLLLIPTSIFALYDNKPVGHKNDLHGAVEIEGIDETTVILVQQKIDELVQRGAKTVTIKINSDGGGVEPGNILIQYLEEKIKLGVKTKCIVDYRARSMAFVLLQSGGCQERLATTRSMFLAHEPSFEVAGNKKRFLRVIQYLDTLSNNMADIVGNRLNIGVEGYKQRIEDGDWIFSYAEAIEVGAIDGSIAPQDIPYTYKLIEDSSD